MSNQALNVNYGIGGVSDLSITDRGSDWYWAVCAIMGASTFAFMGMAMGKPRSHRLFHYITALITLVAGIAYYTMAAGLGATPVRIEFARPDSTQVGGAGVSGTREIFYARYIDWAITTPLLLTDLLLTAALPWPTIMTTIVADEVMVVCGLIGALTPSTYKWGYWAFGTFAFFFVVWNLTAVGLKSARALGAGPGRVYLQCGVLTIFLWFLYPIAWGVSEGGNVIHPDGEAIFYGILDILAKPVFGFLLLFGHRSINPVDLGLHIAGDTTNGHTGTTGNTGVRSEKRGLFGRKNKVSNGTTTGTNNTTTATNV